MSNIKFYCHNDNKKNRYGLAKCKKCNELSDFIHLALWTDNTLRCPICFNITDVVNIPKDLIVKCNKDIFVHQKPIAMIVLDGLYIAGAQRHCLFLIESFKKLNMDSVLVVTEGGGMWASKFIVSANCTIIATKFNSIKWDDIVNVLGSAVSRISFVSAHLVDPIKWCISNVPKNIRLYANLHSEPSEHELVNEHLMSSMSERATRIFFPSLATMEVYKKLYKTLISSKQFCVLNNALLNEDYNYIKRHYNKDCYLNIAVISRIDDDKFSIHLFIKVVTMLIEHIPNFKVVIAGDGDKMTELSNEVRNNQLQSFVDLKGFIYEIEKIYQWAHVVFLPSKRESMPYVMLESLSYGLPIILPNTGFVKYRKEESNVFVYECENAEDALRQFKTVEKTLQAKERSHKTAACDWTIDVKSKYGIGT